MRRSSTVSTSRQLDAVYDPVYLAGSAGPSYSALYRPVARSPAAELTVRRPDGSLVSVERHSHQPLSADATHSASSASLRRAVQGANRLKYMKRPLRAFVPPANQPLAAQQPPYTDTAPARLSNSLTSASPFAGRLLDTPSTRSSSTAAGLTNSSATDGSSSSSNSNTTMASSSLSAVVNVGSQSVYRESGSQTVPYSPDVLLDPEPSPEVVELLGLQSTLTYDNGTLPALLDAVEIVEAAREKARWEASLPPLSSVGGYEKRKRMVEQREWTEWKAKEANIRAEQERAMLTIRAQQDDRDSRQQQRIADAMEAKDREMEQRAAEADSRRREDARRAMRVLGKQRLRDEKRTAFLTGGLLEVDALSGQFAAEEEKNRSGGAAALSYNSRSIGGTSSSASALLELSRADAVFAAVDFSSEVYAPLQRNGAAVAYAHKRTVVDFDIPALSDYNTLTALHNKAVGRAQTDTERSAAEAAGAGGGAGERLRLPSIDRPVNRRESRERQHLMHVDAQIAEQKEQTSLERASEDRWATAAPNRWRKTSQATAASSTSASSTVHTHSVLSSAPVNVYKHFCPVQRAPTPSLPSSQSEEDGQRVAVTLLQRLVRGRAQQNSLITQASQRQHLIREMVQVAQQTKQQPPRDHSTSDDMRDGGSVTLAVQEQQHEGADEASSVLAAGVRSSDSAAAAVESLPVSSLSSSLMLDILLGSLLSDDVSSLLAGRQQSDALLALSSYMQQAMFVRRVREAEEAGRRQAQEELRQQQDGHFLSTQTAIKQHTAAHHTQHILQRAVTTSVQQQQQQRQQEQEAASSQSDTAGEAADVVIADLLQSFVWPEVELRVARESIATRRFVDAAHYAAQKAICTTEPLATQQCR